MDTTGPGHFRYHSSNCMVYNDSRAINESTIPVLDLICLLLVLLDFHGLSRPEVRHFFRHLHITLQHYYPRIPCITSDLPNHHQVNRPGIPSLPFPESYVVPQIIPSDLGPNLVHAVRPELGQQVTTMQRGVCMPNTRIVNCFRPEQIGCRSMLFRLHLRPDCQAVMAVCCTPE